MWLVILKPIFSKFIGHNIISPISKTAWALKVDVNINLEGRVKQLLRKHLENCKGDVGDVQEVLQTPRCLQMPSTSSEIDATLKSVVLACRCEVRCFSSVVRSRQSRLHAGWSRCLFCSYLWQMFAANRWPGIQRGFWDQIPNCRVKPALPTFRELW